MANNQITEQIRLEVQGAAQLRQIVKDLNEMKDSLKDLTDFIKTNFKKEIEGSTEAVKKQTDALKKEEKAAKETKTSLSDLNKEYKSLWAKESAGKETIYQKYLKYKGITGLAKFASDKRSRNISAYQQQISDLELAYNSKDSKMTKEEFVEKRGELAKNIGKEKTAINRINTAAMVAAKAAKIVSAPFVKLAKDAWDVTKSFVNLESGVATFATATSLITNTAAREQQLKYGLSSSQNFAFTQAKSMLNISSDEDLMFMNVQQREKFLEYMQRYSKWYDQMESSGVLADIQGMQLEFKELKQQLGMELLSWLAANKETIMFCVKGIFEVIKQIANFVMTIASWFAKGNTQNNTFNITATTTNNVSNQTMADAATQNQWAGLVKQVTTSIGG